VRVSCITILFFQAEDGIRDRNVTGVQTCALPISLNKFYHVKEPNQFSPPATVLRWQGKLSPLQAQAAAVVKQQMGKHAHHLLWAVTGAGKTEMTYPAIEQALKRRERVAIASPRV